LWGGRKPLFIDDDLDYWLNDIDEDLKLLFSAMVQWNPHNRLFPDVISDLVSNHVSH
jgi:hypothetical protein